MSHADCFHSHSVVKANRTKFKLAIDYLKELPFPIPPPAIKYAICKEFELSHKQFYYVIGKARGGPKPVSAVVQDLEKQGY